MLHARTLGFVHPTRDNGEVVYYEAPVPDEMEELAALGAEGHADQGGRAGEEVGQVARGVADEGGFDLGGYPGVRAWMQRVAVQPGYLPINAG